MTACKPYVSHLLPDVSEQVYATLRHCTLPRPSLLYGAPVTICRGQRILYIPSRTRTKNLTSWRDFAVLHYRWNCRMLA